MKVNFYLILTALCTSTYIHTSQIAQKETAERQRHVTQLELQMMEDAATGRLTETTLQHYLKQGADINAKNNYGNTPLMQASFNGHTAVVQQLIAAGADHTIVNEKDNNQTARDYATNKDAFDWAVAAGLIERKEYLALKPQAKEIIAERATHVPGLQDVIMGYAYGPSPLDLPPSKDDSAKK